MSVPSLNSESSNSLITAYKVMCKEFTVEQSTLSYQTLVPELQVCVGMEIDIPSHAIGVLKLIKGSKKISIKMLKDVGMTVPKSRKTSAVYICSKTGNEGTIFICNKTEDEDSILYAPRQEMRACNNNNMRNPTMKKI